MNCQNFQNDLPEYMEGGLAPDQRRAADRHLAECPECRHLLQREHAMARTLSQGFRQSVQHLTLPPDFQKRLATAIGEERAAKIIPLRESSASGWARFLWPVGIAACVLFTIMRTSPLAPGGPPPVAALIPPDISLQFVYCAPKYTFHREGNQVVDMVECEPRTVDISFHQDSRQKKL